MMARGGVTFTEVDEAARYLQGVGRAATVDAIRERLGTGSRTTLAEHLKRWKALQADGQGRLPQPLVSLVSGLWDSLQSLAEQRIQENQSIAHQEVSSLKSQLHTAQQIENKLGQERHQLQEAHANLQQKQIEKLNSELLVAQQLTQSFSHKIAVYIDQLQRAKTESEQANDKIETLRQEKLFLSQEKAHAEGILRQLQSGNEAA
jgi:chromosome segregation ATPase